MRAYKLLVMFFRMCSSPSMFQTMMNNIFNDMCDIIVVYINDILVFTCGKSSKEHVKLIEEDLQYLKDNNLYVKPSKHSFKVSEVKYLGWWVSKDGVQMDGKKLKDIHEWSTSTT